MAATTSLKSAVASGGCTKAPTWSIAEPPYSQLVGDHPPTVLRRSSIIGAIPRLRRPTSPARDSSDVRNGPRLTDGCSDRHAFAGSPDDAEDSAGSSPVLPNQCGTLVSNAATSPAGGCDASPLPQGYR